MRVFQNMSVRWKQKWIIMLTSGLALLLACLAIIIYDAIAFRREIVESVSSLAEVVGNNTTAAIDFDDASAAEQTLAALRGEPNIIYACLRLVDGRVFAHYGRDESLTPPALPVVRSEHHEFTANHLYLARPVVQGAEAIGMIELVANLDGFRERLWRYAAIVAIVFAGSLLLAFWLSTHLERLITQPLLHLAQVARSVAQEENYAVRATKRGEDEVGQLIDGFNEMLAQIQTRDLALVDAREQLERRVKERTRELVRSLSLLNATLESTADGILVIDHQGRVTSHNDKFVRMWGLPPDKVNDGVDGELLALVVDKLKDGEAFLARIKTLYAHPESESHDTLELRDGRVFERYSQPQRQEDQCVGRVWCFRDITERQRADDALRQSESQFRLVWDTSADGMRLADRDGVVWMANDAYCRIVEKTKTEVEGQPFPLVYSPDNAIEVLREHQSRMDTDAAPMHLENRVTLWNGRQAWLELSSSVLELPGRPRLLLTIFRDITRRKHAEAELQQAHRRLLDVSRAAGMAEVATSVLHNVGNVLNSVNTSVSVVADRLKTSKADGISRVADLLESNRRDLAGFLCADGRADQLVNFLRRLDEHFAAERTAALDELAELTNNIGHIKEIVAMQQNYARVSGVTETIQVRDLVEDALRMNEGALARHRVRLVRDYEPNLPDITVDKHKVLQILINLIRNGKYALEDSERADKLLSLRVTRAMETERVRIVVADNGIGIPPENLTRIFNHGFTTRENGHGFGLHSCALAAKDLGGSLTVHSEGPGNGAEFTLTLPRTPQEVMPSQMNAYEQALRHYP